MIDVLKSDIEYRSCEPGEAGHDGTKFTVEIAKKKQGPIAQHCEARVVNRAERVGRLG